MTPDFGFDHAIRAAANSTIRTHRTGCAVYDRAGRLLATGWSHVPPGDLAATPWSMHAENHALSRVPPRSRPYKAVVATLTRNGNITRGDPCSACADILRRRGVRVVEATQRPEDT
jgi:tRNA(Arg) A34 adenosine deaminase TadA